MLQKSIGEILVELGALSVEQVQQLGVSCQQDGALFDECIRGFGVKDIDLAHAYAKKFEYQLLDSITEKIADSDLLSKIPLKFLREQIIIPVVLQDVITLVVANPFNFQPIDELTLLLGDVAIAIGTKATIIEGINKYYPLESAQQMIEDLAEEKEFAPEMDFAAISEEDILGMASEAPIIKLVNHILYQAAKRGASDIHFEPFEKELRVRYRIDGVLYPGLIPPKRAQAAISSRVKIMANLNIAEKRQPQDGRIQIKIADKSIDIRVSVLPVVHGERLSLRLLDQSKTFSKIEDIGFNERDFKVVMQAIEQPNGIVLITGPTGSGKTSTLYSILSVLNSPEVNVITVEDPVEYQMAGVGQVQVREKIGLTFAAALRSILRQDPDIVMIGEMRDQETAQIAVQAALTGHLVLSTLHTNSAAATITRLIDMGIEPFLIASTIVSVMGQRLVRRLCEQCKKAYTPDAEILQRLHISAAEAQKIIFYEAVGCDLCLQTGYKGRLAIFEVMVMTHAIARLTIERADTALIQNQAIKDGMTLLFDDGVRRITMGLTTAEEVFAVASSQDGIVV